MMRIKSSILLIVFLFGTVSVFAQSADDLKSKIEDKNNQIKQLEEEIKQYNTEVDNAIKQGTTLKNTIKTLDITQKKLTTDINLTESKISKTNLTIEELDNEINETKDHIDTNKQAIISAFRNRQILEDTGFLVLLLSYRNIHDIWNDIDNTRQIQEQIKNKSNELSILQDSLEAKQNNLEGQKKSLVGFKQNLNSQKQVVEANKQEKNTLLVQTKNKEQTFKELAKVKEQQKSQFEKELFEFESQLNILIDKGSYPRPKAGILSWPLDNAYVTQKFGKTVGAEKLYASGSHNGVDLRATTGTQVKAALSGIVIGNGNTDAYQGCYSFGKWVMIKHINGLSTIYAHLSVISVSNGEQLKTGDILGYSGNTGYSTGPHLHFGVYATQGIRIEKFVNSRGCKQVVMPLADIRAYLDPLDYLPAI